ncbi:WAT1-related protein At5g40210-like isoform X2 [Trifolium pratense]|uniref:WAT1-related protein At5g40210-like isoform X2 n=1 Tax=Trifolium pratense TaxID=57577 RepID=UPI001E696E94|nr:WAT1-related protein At5g40210-like isoform X2 [Trifolium pratense]
MDRRYCYKDLLPFVVLVGNECMITGVNTLFKAATLQGMSKYVFVTYSYTFATIFFFSVYFFYRSRVVPQLSFSILSKIALLGVIGGSAQILGYTGISYSSPTLSSAIGNLIPAFTFILAAICRMEKLAIKTRTTQAKVLGSIISISATFAFCVGLLAETNSSLWKIRLDISLISIVCTGIFGKFMGNAIYAWAIHLKGPVYVAMFKPLSIVIAVVMGMVFLGDTLHIGSIVGATIISIGLYAVLWGKASEEIEEDVGTLESPSTENVALLQSYRTDQTFEKKTDRNV